MRILIGAAAAAAIAACTAPDGAAPPAAADATNAAPAASGGAPAVIAGEAVDFGQANVPEFRPAVAGQTRAPAAQRTHAWTVQTVASGLPKPWSFEPLGDGTWLMTTKQGSFHIVGPNGQATKVSGAIPAVDSGRQGALLDVALAPDFAQSGRIFWSYSEPRPDGDGTAVATGVLTRGAAPSISYPRVLWRMQPTIKSQMHYGSRLVFARDGTLFVTLGERSILPGRAQAQDLNSHFGKIVRINADGSTPRDNPFVNRAGARADIYAYGVRNVQAATLHPRTGELWEVEHGPKGGDEVNIIRAGRDYGWPTITYGEEYSGAPIGRSLTQAAGMEQPVYYWDPVIAPSGMLFYSGDLFPAWRDSLFIGGLSSQAVVRLVLDGERVVAEERLPMGARVRDVKQGPDGALYVLTEEDQARILRITPRT
jgi:aldose sugar dehydrogenase